MGIKIDKNVPAMEREIEYLLYDLCVKWGYGISPIAASEISRSTSLEAFEFAEKVLEGEGLNPKNEKRSLHNIAEMFRCRFGINQIHKDTFVDLVRGEKEQW